MSEFDPTRFSIEFVNGEVRCIYQGVEIPRWRGEQGGRGSFFNIDDKFFVKTCYGGDWSQCRTETFQYAKIESQDLKYFTKLLYACDFQGPIHWNVWKYEQLETFSCRTYKDEMLFDRCRDIVFQLCSKYAIADVRDFVNGNWWIHNGEPLIVDLGCD